LTRLTLRCAVCVELNVGELVSRTPFGDRCDLCMSLRLSPERSARSGGQRRPSLGPREWLVLDGREHEGMLMRAGVLRMMALVIDGREIAQ
jgi:sarcosine oxidase gamma subunit